MEHLERLALIRPRRLLRKLRTQRLDNLLIAVSWNGQCWKKIGKSAMMYYGHDGHNRVMNGSECFWVVIKAITYQWPRHTYRWQALSGLLQHVAFLSYNVYIYIYIGNIGLPACPPAATDMYIYIYTYTSNWANVRFCGNIERKKCFVYIYIYRLYTHPSLARNHQSLHHPVLWNLWRQTSGPHKYSWGEVNVYPMVGDLDIHV